MLDGHIVAVVKPGATAFGAGRVYKLTNTATREGVEKSLVEYGMEPSYAKRAAPKFYDAITHGGARRGSLFLAAAAGTYALIEFVEPENAPLPVFWKLVIAVAVGGIVIALFAGGQRSGMMKK